MSMGRRSEKLGYQQSTVCCKALPGDWCRQNAAIGDWVGQMVLLVGSFDL